MEQTTEQLLEELKDFLVATQQLSEKYALLYIFALRNGPTTSTDVTKELKRGASTARTWLNVLANKGFLSEALREGKSKEKGRRGKPSVFWPVAPSRALSTLLEKHQHLVDNLGVLDQLCELAAERARRPDDIWMIHDEDVALKDVQDAIRSATISVKIHSHDCDWLSDTEVCETLQECAQKGVEILAVITTSDGVKRAKLRGMHVKVYSTEIRSVPFCVIDDKLLILATRWGPRSNRYGSITTTIPYLVENHVSLFKSMTQKTRKQGR